MSNLGAVHYGTLDLTGSKFSQFHGFPVIHFDRNVKFQHNRTMRGWVIDDLANFPGQVCGGDNFVRSCSQRWGERSKPNLRRTGNHLRSNDCLRKAPMILDFRFVVSFRNQVASNAKAVENLGQISDFLFPLCKNYGGGRNIWVRISSFIGSNLWYTFGAGPLDRLGDSRHCPIPCFREQNRSPIFSEMGIRFYTRFWQYIKPSSMLHEFVLHIR